MANPLRGEVDLVVGEKTYVIRLSINAMVEAETVMGMGIGDVIAELQDRPKLGTLRALLWAGLREHQPKITLEAAGEIIAEIGFQKVAEIVGNALSLAFPDEGGGSPSPDATQG